MQVFENDEELNNCLARAKMQADLDNALRQLELETRNCIEQRYNTSGNWFMLNNSITFLLVAANNVFSRKLISDLIPAILRNNAVILQLNFSVLNIIFLTAHTSISHIWNLLQDVPELKTRHDWARVHFTPFENPRSL